VSLWLCLRFEQLPLQCLNRSEEEPVVVLSKQRVIRSNDCAAALGIRRGMGTATVRALAEPGSVQLLERDTTAEQRSLQQLCCWAYSVTPTLYTFQEDCLQLEIGGCLKLFQGLEPLMATITRGTTSRGYRVQTGMASTPKAAWLLSHADVDTAMDTGQDLKSRLAPLPLKLLDSFSSAVDSLQRAGLNSFGDIFPLPLAALGRRCGQEFIHFLQQLLGEREDLQGDYQPPKIFSDQYWFGYEVKVNAELLPAIQVLLQSLCLFLRHTQLRTGEIEWQLIGIDSKLHPFAVRSASSHSHWQSWYQLSCIHIDQLKLSGSVEGIALLCHSLHTGELENIDLFNTHKQREPLNNLLDRLRSRMGLQAVEHVGCRDEHLPEFALHIGNDSPKDTHDTGQPCTQRPFWLMPQPQRLRQHGSQLYWNGPIELIYGPERIEDNWWREAVSRDYYIARDGSGQHYWVFSDRLTEQWFLHGIFA